MDVLRKAWALRISSWFEPGSAADHWHDPVQITHFFQNAIFLSYKMGIICAFWGWKCVAYMWRIRDNKLPRSVISNTSTAWCSGSRCAVPSPAASAPHARKVNAWAPTQTFWIRNSVGRGQQFLLAQAVQVILKLAEIWGLFGRAGKCGTLIWKMG